LSLLKEAYQPAMLSSVRKAHILSTASRIRESYSGPDEKKETQSQSP